MNHWTPLNWTEVNSRMTAALYGLPVTMENVCCHGNVLTEPLASNGLPLWLRYSGFQKSCHNILLITVVARSKAWNVFACSNTGIVGSNPTEGMNVCLRLFCVCVGRDLATGWSPFQGILPTVLGLRNWSETKRFKDAPCSKVGATREREYNLCLY
jgi:hypothetical protein